MRKPAITVLMPVYNAEKFLAEAIDSILRQAFTDFEFLIIDDGSSDNSVRIVRSYADARIRFLQNEKNLGITATLNKGIAQASADLIARMDADDISYPDRLQKQYEFIMAHPEGVLFSCWAREVSEEKIEITTERFEPGHYFYNLPFSFWFYHPTLVYRRKAVMDVGMYTVPYAEDCELVWQLSRKYKMYQQPEVLLDYRITSQSLWQVTKKQEYREAQLKQVRRNICYYLNEDPPLQEWQLDCLGNIFDTMPPQCKVDEVAACIRYLDLITQKILERENVNRKVEDIKAAAKFKRDHILSCLVQKLGRKKGALLLLQAQSWKMLGLLATKRLKAPVFKLFCLGTHFLVDHSFIMAYA